MFDEEEFTSNLSHVTTTSDMIIDRFRVKTEINLLDCKDLYSKTITPNQYAQRNRVNYEIQLNALEIMIFCNLKWDENDSLIYCLFECVWTHDLKLVVLADIPQNMATTNTNDKYFCTTLRSKLEHGFNEYVSYKIQTNDSIII